MVRLGLVAFTLALQLGCVCGSFQISDTLATDADGEGYNGHWTEECGVNFGASGTWNLFGDGYADLTFFPNAPGDRSWQGVDIEMGVRFDHTLLAPGTTIPYEQLSGGAALNPCISCAQDGAGLTAGELRVVGGWEGGDACAEDDGPVVQLTWDLTYGAAPGPTYTATGNDKVRFSTFLSDDCDTGY